METQSSPSIDTHGIALTSADLDTISESSRPFIGNWHAVVSQTNWEKGQIINQWRSKLEDSGVAPWLFSDPVWTRLVGEVSPQHVGRLRRTYDRFGDVYGDYAGLYWSHFFAALDWHNAEMWLEGAVQNNWSVSKMRYQRWETMGAIEDQRPDPLSIVSSPDEEGVIVPPVISARNDVSTRDDLKSVRGTNGPLSERPDFGDADDHPEHGPRTNSSMDELAVNGNRVDIEGTLALVPDDISRPFVELREALTRYRDENWQGVNRIHLVALLNDLRQLLRKVSPDKRETDECVVTP